MSAVRVAAPQVYGLHEGSDVGGEVYERELCVRLGAHGVSLVLGLPPGHAPMPGEAAVDVLSGAGRRHWLTAPLVFAPWVARLLRAGRVEVLRGPSVRWAGPSLLAGRRLARSRAPVVLHHHHFSPRWRALEAAILRRADGVITVSEHSRSELVAAGVDAARIHVALDGVAGPAPAAAPAPSGAWPAGGLALLYVGRLEARKRPDVAVQTLAALHRGGIEASLVLAGDGPQRPVLEAAAAAAGIAERVRFCGRVTEERKWRLYDEADVLLFASTLEGFGMVIAEAQSRGLPVVAAAGTATVEAFAPGVTGLLSEPTGEAFAGAVRSLLAPDRLAAMSSRAAEFGARFSWDRCAEEVAAVLRGVAADAVAPSAGSEPYDPDNLLDRLSDRSTLQVHYDHLEARERAILDRRLGLRGGRVLSVGAGWHPGRHLFGAPAFELVAVDADPAKVAGVRREGRADEALVGRAGELAFAPASFDVVLYRLVMHHIVFHGSLAPCFAEAARLLAPGGALVVIEPGLWHPVGAGLALANRAGLGERIHGTPDDVPLSPRRLMGEARAAGLHPELYAVTYTWRRLPRSAQRALQPLDALGSRRWAAPFGHTLLLLARKR